MSRSESPFRAQGLQAIGAMCLRMRDPFRMPELVDVSVMDAISIADNSNICYACQRQMSWVVFSYSLPSAGRSSPRVAVWRRLRALGAIVPKGGVHVLPARDDCVEAFQWLAQEVEQAKGEALLLRVERFEGL